MKADVGKIAQSQLVASSFPPLLFQERGSSSGDSRKDGVR